MNGQSLNPNQLNLPVSRFDNGLARRCMGAKNISERIQYFILCLFFRLSKLYYGVTHPKDDQFSRICRKVPVSSTVHISVRKWSDVVM